MSLQDTFTPPGFADRVVSEVVAAEYIGLSTDTLKRACARGEGPRRIKLSTRRIGYRLRDLDAWLDQRVIGAP